MANLYVSPSSPGLLQRGPYQLVSEPSISWSIHGGSPELHQLKSYYSQGRSGSWQGFRPETPFQPSISVTSSISAASPHEQSSCSSNGKISQHKDSIDRMLDKLDHMNNELDRVLKEMVRERKEREVQQYMSASLSNSVGNRNPIHVYPTPLQHPYTSAQHVFDEMLTRGGGGGEAPTKAAPLPEPPPPPSFPQPPQQQYRSLQQQEETEPEVFDEVSVRKLGSISWCRRCKIQCATMEGLVLHSLTSEHQNKTMALVLNIKQDIQSGANYASMSEKIASVFAEDSTPGASVAKTDDARLVTRKLREADVAKLELKEDPTATYEDLAIAVTDANDFASTQKQVVQSIGELASSGSVVDDWVGSDPIAEMSTTGSRSEDDPLAEVSFHVTEDKKHDDSGGYNMDLLDFSTVYRFYHYPDTTRLRMSQILTLPPYQSQGYGGRLLESIYSVAISETGLSYSKNWDELRDEKVLADARWAMSYLSEGTNDKIQAVIDAGVCPRLIELLPLPSHTILIHVLRTVRNIVTGDVFVSATYVGASFQVWIWDPGSAIHRRGCNCNMDFGEELQYYVGGGLTAALAVWKWLGIDTELESEMVGKAMNTSVSFWSCVPRSDGMEILEKKLYYEFSIKDLLLEAITHAFAQEIGTCYCYQRLEFLSDAVLVLLITWHLFQTHITIDPGVLTDLRSASVNNERFAKCAVKHKLQHHLQPASGLLLEQITEYVKKLEELHKDEYPLVSNASSKGYKVLVDIVESIAGTILIDTRLNLHKVWEISEPLLASMVSPVSLELPPLRELFELYSHLGYFLKTKCKMV